MLSVTVRDTKIIEMWVSQNSSDSVHQFCGRMIIIPFNNEEDGVRETIWNRSLSRVSRTVLNEKKSGEPGQGRFFYLKHFLPLQVI